MVLLSMEQKGSIIFTVITILWSIQPISTDDGVFLQVNPHNLAVEVGENATLQCFHYPEGAHTAGDYELEWFMPNYNIPISQLKHNQTVINETQSAILRYTSENGTLTIINASAEDAGTYTCKDVNASLIVEAVFKVFAMPSYFTEAMVVIAINAVLLVIFITCYVWRTVQDIKKRREQKENRRKAKLGHKSLAKKMMA